MKIKIDIVIGSMYGDEGKGQVVDALAHQTASETLVIRYSGTAQAGHTVFRSKEKQHIFKTIGSASFKPGTKTLLASPFVLEPIALNSELNLLRQKGIFLEGKLFIDKNCRIITPWDRIKNEERLRKDGNQTCGYGLLECLKREKQLTAGDLLTGDLVELVTEQRALYKGQIELYDENLVFNFIQDLKKIKEHTIVSLEEFFAKSVLEHVIFESSQGLMLDQERIEFFPYLTPSSVSSEMPLQIIHKYMKDETPTVYYVTRPYHTRHGAGPFGFETNEINLEDKTNKENSFQGRLRFGFFDLENFKHNLELDQKKHLSAANFKIAMTQLERTGEKVLMPEGKIPVKDFAKLVKEDIVCFRRIGN